MPKRSLNEVAGDESRTKRQRLSKPDRLSHLSDELILRILSYLSVTDLNLCQSISHRFRSIAGDSQLWKAHYYKRFVRPRASRIPGLRPSSASTVASHLHFSSKLSKWLDEQNLVRGGNKTDWKRQYKLRHNWARGACRVSKIEVAEQPTIAPLQLRMHESTVYSVGSGGGLRAWSLKGKKRLIAETELVGNASAPTSLAIDAQAAEGSQPLVVVGFQNGAFRIFQLKLEANRFDQVYAHSASTNGMLLAVAFSYPYLLTMTAGQLLSLYKFSAENVALLDSPRILQSLRSQTVSQPVSLSIRANSTGITASIAYSVPSIVTSGWSVGLQEMRLTTEGKLVESRLATSAVFNRSWTFQPSHNAHVDGHQTENSIFQRPSSLSYNHPYMLVSHEDNTLTLYLAISDRNTLSIGPGKRLWGHTSAVSAAHVGGRGKAVSVSQRGSELRVWELEKTLVGRRDAPPKLTNKFSVLVRPEVKEKPGESTEKQSSLGMAGITEAIRRRGNGLGLALEERFDENFMNKSLVGFDEENVVVLSERRSGSQALVVYDFT